MSIAVAAACADWGWMGRQSRRRRRLAVSAYCRRLGAGKIADEGVEGAAKLDDGLWVGGQAARCLTAIVETRQRRKRGRRQRDVTVCVVDERFGGFHGGRRLGEQDVFVLRRLSPTLFLRWRRRACLRLLSSFCVACCFEDVL